MLRAALLLNIEKKDKNIQIKKSLNGLTKYLEKRDYVIKKIFLELDNKINKSLYKDIKESAENDEFDIFILQNGFYRKKDIKKLKKVMINNDLHMEKLKRKENIEKPNAHEEVLVTQ
jgi:hypothetical protein